MITEHPGPGIILLVVPAGVPAISGGVVRPSHLFEVRWDVPPLNWDVLGQVSPAPPASGVTRCRGHGQSAAGLADSGSEPEAAATAGHS